MQSNLLALKTETNCVDGSYYTTSLPLIFCQAILADK